MVDKRELQILITVQLKVITWSSTQTPKYLYCDAGNLTKNLFSISCEPCPQMGKRVPNMRPRQRD